MPRMPRTAALICVFALALAACGRTPEEIPVPTSEDLCQGASGGGPKVGMAYDIGGRNDRGINDAAFAGLSEAVDEFNATCLEGEAAAGEQEAARVDRLRHFAANGATVIVAIGTRYARAVDTVAQSYPRIRFALIDAAAPKREFTRNVAVLNFVPEQAAFLAGVAAALKSRSGTVGFVGAPPAEGLEPAEPYEAGFSAGVTAAKPSVKVLATHLEVDTPAPGRPETATKVVTAQIEEGADVVFGSPGVSQRALFNAARSAAELTWVVGVGADQFQSATEDQKPHILTSVIKRVDTVTYDFIESVAAGEPMTGRHLYGIDEDGIDYVTSGTFLTRRNIAVIDEFKGRVESGNIEVPDEVR